MTEPSGLRVAYLGPPGTFSEEACLERFGADVQLIGCDSISEVVDRLVIGDADRGVVPFENTRVGAIAEAHEQLALHSHLLEVRERIELPVPHQLVAATGSHIDDITVVTSHPQALAQCGEFLRRHLASIPSEPASSTATAVIRAAAERGVAAIASERAARMHGVSVIAADIQDPGESITTFAVLRRT